LAEVNPINFGNTFCLIQRGNRIEFGLFMTGERIIAASPKSLLRWSSTSINSFVPVEAGTIALGDQSRSSYP
jgi:hypothetical protein